MERVLMSLKPDFMSQVDVNNYPAVKLEFILLKIVCRVARLGKDPKTLFRMWDTDNNDYRKFTNEFNLWFSGC